jgi:hypothetical protein
MHHGMELTVLFGASFGASVLLSGFWMQAPWTQTRSPQVQMLAVQPLAVQPIIQTSLDRLEIQTVAQALPPLSTADTAIFQAIAQQVRNQPSHPSFSNLLQIIAEQFVGAPYAEGLLDQGASEQLVVNLEQFDCVLFVETVLALARDLALDSAMVSQSPVFPQYLQEQRYRQQVSYCDRLHYFSDWIFENRAKGIVQDLTPQLGGIPLNKSITFMSMHRQSYPQLADESNYQCIVSREDHLSEQNIRYIPTAEISQIYSQLQPGDIVAIATAVPGLDVTHTGLVYQTATSTGMIHAAPGRGVRITSDLQAYVAQVEEAIGIMVARPQSPRP